MLFGRPLGSIAIYVEDPNEDLTEHEGIYTLEQAADVDPLKVRGIVVSQAQYDELRASLDLNVQRARLLGLLNKRGSRFSLPIRRRVIDPNDFRNMFNPLRIRRDYTSVGRPTFLLGYTDLPEPEDA